MLDRGERDRRVINVSAQDGVLKRQTGLGQPWAGAAGPSSRGGTGEAAAQG